MTENNCFTYVVGNGVYINLTNSCDMNCDFCIRRGHEGTGDADSLWLSREPSADEVISELTERGLANYSEVVFCGFGEPSMRLQTMFDICDAIKKLPDCPPVRVNTNGHASLIAGRDTAPEFAGRFDVVSVSLNAEDAKTYNELCHPDAGEEAYGAMLDFVSRVKDHVPKTMFTVVDVISAERIELCRKVAESCGVPLRVRNFY